MKHYIWLLPGGKEALRLQQVINDLARGFSQSVFPAHLTLWSGFCNPKSVQEWIKASCTRLPIEAQIQQATFGETYFQCIYLPITPNTELSTLQQLACTNFAGSYNFSPHLSVLYGDHSLARKRDVSNNLNLPFSRIHFNQCALVQGSARIEDWQILYRFPLPVEL